MPYPNEHACRIADPKQFDRVRRKNSDQSSSGKPIDVIYGIKDGKSTIQALRYDKRIWTRQAAESHCKSRNGTFEPAIDSNEKPSPISLTYSKKYKKDKR